MSSNPFNNNSEDQSDQMRKRQQRYRIDTAINWIFLVLVSIIGYTIIESDIDTYQGEKLFHRLLNDGVAVEEETSPYMQQGMARNMKYKGVSTREFFIAKWKWRVPIYLSCIFLPLLVGFVRVMSKDRRRWNWAYFPMILTSVSYGLYFWGRWRSWW